MQLHCILLAPTNTTELTKILEQISFLICIYIPSAYLGLCTSVGRAMQQYILVGKMGQADPLPSRKTVIQCLGLGYVMVPIYNTWMCHVCSKTLHVPPTTIFVCSFLLMYTSQMVSGVSIVSSTSKHFVLSNKITLFPKLCRYNG